MMRALIADDVISLATEAEGAWFHDRRLARIASAVLDVHERQARADVRAVYHGLFRDIATVTCGQALDHDGAYASLGVWQNGRRRVYLTKQGHPELQDGHVGGLDDEPMTLTAIGDVLQVTGERVRAIEAKALRKLRHSSRRKLLEDFVDD